MIQKHCAFEKVAIRNTPPAGLACIPQPNEIAHWNMVEHRKLYMLMHRFCKLSWVPCHSFLVSHRTSFNFSWQLNQLPRWIIFFRSDQWRSWPGYDLKALVFLPWKRSSTSISCRVDHDDMVFMNGSSSCRLVRISIAERSMMPTFKTLYHNRFRYMFQIPERREGSI